MSTLYHIPSLFPKSLIFLRTSVPLVPSEQRSGAVFLCGVLSHTPVESERCGRHEHFSQTYLYEAFLAVELLLLWTMNGVCFSLCLFYSGYVAGAAHKHSSVMLA